MCEASEVSSIVGEQVGDAMRLHRSDDIRIVDLPASDGDVLEEVEEIPGNEGPVFGDAIVSFEVLYLPYSHCCGHWTDELGASDDGQELAENLPADPQLRPCGSVVPNRGKGLLVERRGDDTRVDEDIGVEEDGINGPSRHTSPRV